jgi:hypothetical protein
MIPYERGNSPDKACLGKEAFPTASRAARAAASLRRRKRTTIEHYACPYCGMFHIGNKRSTPRTPRSRRLILSEIDKFLED